MIKLEELSNGMPAITPSFGQYLAEAGAVCLESQGHNQGRVLTVEGSYNGSYSLTWPNTTDQMMRLTFPLKTVPVANLVFNC